jgi:hypothetical protein
MCHSEPTIYGMSLDLAMHIDDGIPDCCYGPMAKGKEEACTCCAPEDTDGAGTGVHVEYKCGDCGTVVEVDGLGLVFDIREKTAA